MKPLSDDKDYPFGAIVRQITANTGTSNERVTSSMNVYMMKVVGLNGRALSMQGSFKKPKGSRF